MYNGIGLQTPRGSGTTGHIQSNKFSVAKSTNKVNDKIAAAARRELSLAAPPTRRFSSTNGRARSSFKLVVLEDNLMDHGYSDAEMAKNLAEACRNLESGGEKH